MAKRKPRGKKRQTSLSDLLQPFLRGEVLGVALLVLGLVTLLALVSWSRGTVTEWWVRSLRRLVGVGVYGVPAALGAGGIWLILRGLGREPQVRGETVAGMATLSLLLLTLIHLLWPLPAPQTPEALIALAQEGKGGGHLGGALARALWITLGFWGSCIVLAFFLLANLLWLGRVSLADLLKVAQDVVREVRRRAGTLPRGWVQAPLPGMEGNGLHPTLQRALEAAPSPPVEPGRSAVLLNGTQPRRPPPAEPPPARIIGASEERWELPSIAEIFADYSAEEISQQEIRRRERIIEETLRSFGVPVTVKEVNIGPTVTQFSVEPGYLDRKDKDGKPRKVKVSQITALANDLALALSASPIRIEAPIPGRPYVGIEVPNPQMALVSLRSVIDTEEFRSFQAPLKIALGQDVSGRPVFADLGVMPHLLIAGATGSGKSVCINAIVACLLAHNPPTRLRFLMVDPKMVELTLYNGVPHLLAPVVVDLERVVSVLKWATREMDRRYRLFNEAGARHLDAYNELAARRGEVPLPYIVIVIDELADLMMLAPEEVERAICRIAQMARATGIHLVIATQRPSVDVVTGLIKANFPARISFAVSSQVDSRVILDAPGAERLLGRGDMLFMAPDAPQLVRLQGCYVSDEELQRLVRFWKGVRTPEPSTPARPTAVQQTLWEDAIPQAEEEEPEQDEMYERALEVLRETKRASISLLQRRLRIGYTRAARLIERMEQEGIVGPPEGGTQTRKVLFLPERDRPPWGE
ncbi:MAG: DNA translocase FtsK [Anaerolineae bacterium]